MKIIRTLAVAAALAAAPLSVTLLASPAVAQVDAVKATVDAAKLAGTVGERWDGYVGPVGSVTPDVKAAIDAMNARRKAVYTEGAAKTGATPMQAGVVFAEKIIADLPKGYYFMPQGGSWTRK